jgi:cytochrome c-type biogenesis protein CcmH/NrfG
MIWLVVVAVLVVGAGAWFVAKSMAVRVAVFASGVLAVGAYFVLGHPDRPDEPLERRIAELEQLSQNPQNRLSLDQLMALEQAKSRENPDDPAPHKMIGDIYAAAGRADEARLSYQSALRRNASYGPAVVALEELHLRQTGQVAPGAAERLQAVGELSGLTPETMTGVQLMIILEQRAAMAPGDAAPHRFMGDLLESVGRPEEAVAAYRAALDRDPDLQPALKGIADARFKSTGQVDAETTDYYGRAYAGDRSDLRLGYLFAIGQWQAGKKAEAQALWSKLEAEVAPGDPRGQMFKALRETFAPESLENSGQGSEGG